MLICIYICMCIYKGMLKATFTPQNRLVYLELSFDVMSFMQQLRRASGKQDFQVVPNTVSIAREDVTEVFNSYLVFASSSFMNALFLTVSDIFLYAFPYSFSADLKAYQVLIL